MKRTIGLLFLIFTVLISKSVMAETAYIVDQLLVGLHQQKDINSPIIKVLSTGTKVEIIRHEGDFAEIRELTADKIGWVDASYLMLGKPAKLQLAELQDKIKDLESQQSIQAAQTIKAENEEKVKKLNKQIEDLKQNLSSEKLKAGELEAKISQQEKKLAKIEAKDDDNRIAELEKQNSELQSQLNVTRQEKPELITPSGNQLPLMQLLSFLKEKPVQILLGILILAAFLFGRHWEDRKNRRKHGGFRI